MENELISGKYKIQSRIGEGGMAVVYLATCEPDNSPVAVKMIRSELVAPKALPVMIRRFHHEVQLLQKLKHPGIVQLLDFGEHQGQPYLVMEYAKGGTLKQLMGKRMAWQKAIGLTMQITEALAFAHSRGVIHRDIKPSNILLDESGKPFVTDFGIGRMVESESTSELTHTGGISGTPRYMAPEQWRGQINEHSDVYAVGVVLYEMLTGRMPYQSDLDIPYMVLQSTQSHPTVRSLVRSVPMEVNQIVERCLVKDPSHRYANMNALVQELARVSTSPLSKKTFRFEWQPLGILLGVFSRFKNILRSTPPARFFGGLVIAAILSALLMNGYLVYLKKKIPMTLVPAGEFIMGNPYDVSYPEHIVYLDNYYIDTYEVTNRAYRDCVTAGGCEPPLFSDNEFYNNPEFDNHPIVLIYRDEARKYCEWRGGSLPTEAQWEKAARGTDGREFPWGNTWDETKHQGIGMHIETLAVGTVPEDRSPYGVYDMAWNVQEWTADWYSEDYYKTLHYKNPTGPDSGQFPVIRSSWGITGRGTSSENTIGYQIGFRCVISLPTRSNNILEVNTENPTKTPVVQEEARVLYTLTLPEVENNVSLSRADESLYGYIPSAPYEDPWTDQYNRDEQQLLERKYFKLGEKFRDPGLHPTAEFSVEAMIKEGDGFTLNTIRMLLDGLYNNEIEFFITRDLLYVPNGASLVLIKTNVYDLTFDPSVFNLANYFFRFKNLPVTASYSLAEHYCQSGAEAGCIHTVWAYGYYPGENLDMQDLLIWNERWILNSQD